MDNKFIKIKIPEKMRFIQKMKVIWYQSIKRDLLKLQMDRLYIEDIDKISNSLYKKFEKLLCETNLRVFLVYS